MNSARVTLAAVDPTALALGARLPRADEIAKPKWPCQLAPGVFEYEGKAYTHIPENEQADTPSDFSCQGTLVKIFAEGALKHSVWASEAFVAKHAGVYPNREDTFNIYTSNQQEADSWLYRALYSNTNKFSVEGTRTGRFKSSKACSDDEWMSRWLCVHPFKLTADDL